MDKESMTVKFFSKHLVPIVFKIRIGEHIVTEVMTTFVLSVGERWFLITAGHCIRDIEKLVTDNELISCSLIDYGGLDATDFQPIPYTYDKEKFFNFGEDYGFDYGLIELSPMYIRLLEGNGIVPLNEETWKKQATNPHVYRLLGIPAELIKSEEDEPDIPVSFLNVKPLTEIPDGFTKVDTELFYGKVLLGDTLTSIKGMSGGPIFAFQEYDDGSIRYYVVAIQSRWLPDSHSIAACPISVFGKIIETGIKLIDEGSV